MAADVVGYSHLIQVDEEATLLRFKSLFDEMVAPNVELHGGRIVKTMGDGFLAEFASAIEAVRCAIQIQEQLDQINEPYPDDNRMDLRIGINVGDIVIDSDDVLGDGVNVAARLEGEASPAGICISGSAYDQVKLSFKDQCEFMGELALKNIDEPVRAYNVMRTASLPGRQNVSEKKNKGRANSIFAAVAAIVLIGAAVFWSWTSFGTRSTGEQAVSNTKVAVLPFKNMSNDPNYQFFADGLSQDLITDLSKVAGIPVLSSRSSFGFRDTDQSHDEIAKKLAVRYIVEGSIRRQEQTLRISVNLIDTVSNSQIWAERYDGKSEDVFAFQDQITTNIIKSLKVVLLPSQQVAITTRGTRNEEAYDAFLRGMRYLTSQKSLNVEGNKNAVRSFKEALRYDPNYPQAYAGMAWADWLHYSTINAFTHGRQKSAFKNAEKSISLGETALAHRVLSKKYFSSSLHTHTTNEPQRAIEELNAALAIEPNNPDILTELADVLPFVGEISAALSTVEKAISLNPDHPDWYLTPLGIAQLLNGEYDKSSLSLKAALKNDRVRSENFLWLASAEALSGRVSEAIDIIVGLRVAYNTNIPQTEYAVKRAWPLPKDAQDILLRGLKIAEFPEKIKAAK